MMMMVVVVVVVGVMMLIVDYEDNDRNTEQVAQRATIAHLRASKSLKYFEYIVLK